MSVSFSHLRNRLDEIRNELVAEVVKLIQEDAPKNKFSIVSGKLKMIETIETEMEIIEQNIENR